MEFWRLGVGGAHGSGFNRLSGSGPGKEVTQGGGITGITAFLCFTFVYIIFYLSSAPAQRRQTTSHSIRGLVKSMLKSFLIIFFEHF